MASKRKIAESINNSVPSNPKKKRAALTIEEKFQILNRLEKNESGVSLAKEYGVATTTISAIKHKKEDLLKFKQKVEESDGNLNKKSMKTPSNQKLEDALYLWFCQERGIGSPISGPLLQEKALQLNTKLSGDPKFVASNGWLFKFMNRHGIRELQFSGEKLSADQNSGEKFKKEFEDLVSNENYTRGNVYNCDETGLNWKALPSKTLASKREASCSGPKPRKERVSILFCSNADGSNKLPMMVIGKSKRPRCFKNFKCDLPVIYRNQKSAWMNSEIFKNWFFDDFVPSAKSHNKDHGLPDFALLLMDNASVHPSAEILTTPDGNYKAVFLPPNVTSILQPMDQSVIETFKRYYRRYLLRKYLSVQDPTPEKMVNFYSNFNLLDSILLASEAWEAVKVETLQRSWNKLWPLPNLPELPNEPITDENIASLVQSVAGASDCDFDDVVSWLKEDSRDPGFELLEDDALITKVNGLEEDQDQDEDEDDSESDIIEEPSDEEVVRSFKIAINWVRRQQNYTSEQLKVLQELHQMAAEKINL